MTALLLPGLSIDDRMEHADGVALAGRAAQEEDLVICAESIEYFADHYAYIPNPKGLDKVLPFNLFPRQREFLHWIAAHENRAVSSGMDEEVLADKPRDMGVSWLTILYALHGWLFRTGYQVGFGSATEAKVDILGNMDSLFEKIRFLVLQLPRWLLPDGFRFKEHSKTRNLLNPATGGSIAGEIGDQIGRGGRRTLYIVDEAAHIEHAEMVDSSLMSNFSLRINVSTPNGPGNTFARKRFSFPSERVFNFTWRDDPRKTDEWYAHTKAMFDPVSFAINVEVDYSASVEGITIPGVWVRAAVNLALPESNHAVAGLDISELGDDETVFCWRRGPVVKPLISWKRVTTHETAHRARDEAVKVAARYVWYETSGVGAGVRGDWNSMRDDTRKIPFKPVGVATGGSPTEDRWPDGQTSKEKCRNLRSEMWWILRLRFERTFEHVNKIREHPLEDLISIPHDPQLIAELSLPLHERNETGKIQIESKAKMRSRGVKSPNRADALCLAFCPVVRRDIQFYC